MENRKEEEGEGGRKRSGKEREIKEEEGEKERKEKEIRRGKEIVFVYCLQAKATIRK